MNDPKDGMKMIDVDLSRIVIREGSEQQYIFLQEAGGGRGFPIVIGTVEACEIRRVVAAPERRGVHQIAVALIRSLSG